MLIDARQQFDKEPKAFASKRNRMTDTHRQWIEERYRDGWAMRHTFASNYLALYGAENTIKALGHGDYDMLFRHYREIVSEKDAQKIWDLLPARKKTKVKPAKA